ncbi:hypothetical protein EZV62_007350 [Acer yangbiense]|uniref:Uncharacterized protein n=1 Tax=Acer yangbiense TaxID=1000413 RepID=A0A5C7IA22_9ROSI|nr:hypothetical protein EZV62_007350 [Acer yangbiense]
MVVNRFKMDPLFRSLVIILAQEEKFFNYNSEGDLTLDYSGSDRACLINAEKLRPENQEKMKTLLNKFEDLRSQRLLQSGESSQRDKEIKSLKMLTHLDVSECYLLDHIPKELLWLSDLQFLKGFVITDVSRGNVCTHADLAGLKKLRKLSINVNSETFLIDELSTTLFKLEELEQLKIAWGGGSKAKESTGAGKKNGKAENVFRKSSEKAEE